MAQIEVAELLEVLELVPFEDCVDAELAATLRERIATSITELRGRYGLSATDPLLFGEDGNRLEPKELDVKLETIIQSWPSWQKENKRYGRQKRYKKSV